jgi:hypothetical protein
MDVQAESDGTVNGRRPDLLPLTHARTDRELLVGIFDAVCALAEKLTGERLLVFLPSAAGDWPYSGSPCAWLPTDQREGLLAHAPRHGPEHSSMPPEPR